MNKNIGKEAKKGGKAAWKGVSKAERSRRLSMLVTRRWEKYRAKKALDSKSV